MKPTRLILIPALGSEPAPCLVIAGGRVRDRDLLELHPAEPPEQMRSIAVVPGSEVTIRWLDLPVGGLAQQRAAALWMLKDVLATPADRLAVALGPVPAPGQPRLVAVVGLSLLQAWTDYLDALGIRPEAIVPDALTVSVPEQADRLNAIAFGPATALRGRCFAASVQPDLVSLMAGGRSIEPIENPADVERLLVDAALAPPINLMAIQDRSHGSARRSWALASALAGLLAVSPLVLVASAAARDETAAEADTRRVRAEIAHAAPELANSADPVAALNRRMRAAAPPGGVVGATAALFSAVEGVEGAELDLLIVDPETGMKASVSHDNYEDIQAISLAMRAFGLRVSQTGTLDDRGRVISDISIGSAG